MWRWTLEETKPDEIHMYRFKKSDGGIIFVGVNNTKRTYSTDYYANVGIFNMDEPSDVLLKELKELKRKCEVWGYKKVERLRGNKETSVFYC